MNITKINELLNNSELFNIGEKYIPKDDGSKNLSFQEQFRKIFETASASEVYVPVLGMQGTGKSTLLNALLMDRTVLPVDAQETNCVPTEIRKSPDGKFAIEICFLDNRPALQTTEPTLLEQYVSNVYNNANEKGVSYAVVCHTHPLLDNRMVFVDLPGVLSTTRVNAEVTIKFMQKTAVAIFLLNSYKPLTHSELQFFRAVHDKRSNIWIVQNRWDDESDEECSETSQANAEIIKKELGIMPEVFAFDVKNAFESKFSGVPDEHFTSFIQKLSQFRDNWQRELSEGAVMIFGKFLRQMNEKVTLLIEDLSKTEQQLREEITVVEEEYRQMQKRNAEKIEKIRNECDNFLTKMSGLCDAYSYEVTSQVESQMQQLTQGGMFDGGKFNQTFSDTFSRQAQRKIIPLNDELLSFRDKIGEMLEGIELDIPRARTANAAINLSSQTKFEKMFEPVGSVIGGTVGGIIAASVFGGPIVVAIAAVIGGLFLFFLGKAAKEQIMQDRAVNTMREVRRVLEESRPRLRQEMYNGPSEIGRVIKEKLDRFTEMEKSRIEDTIGKQKERLSHQRGEQEEKRNQYNKELQVIASALEVVNA